MHQKFPLGGAYLYEIHRVSHLFTTDVSVWYDVCIVVNYGSYNEQEFSFFDVSPMKVFGYRSRLRYLYDNIPQGKNGDLGRYALAEYIKDNIERDYQVGIDSLSFLKVKYFVGSDQLRRPRGTWSDVISSGCLATGKFTIENRYDFIQNY